jgi:hypothetical protein
MHELGAVPLTDAICSGDTSETISEIARGALIRQDKRCSLFEVERCIAMRLTHWKQHVINISNTVQGYYDEIA